MESARDTKHTRIQMKHALIIAIVILTTLSLIASIVLITIGYMNPFGMVGLGILGAGCVLYFLTIIFLCSTGICVKNKYYPDENDFNEKLPRSASEDISLLKPAANVTSPRHNEVGCRNKTERPSDNNMLPLYSVSTVYSSVSSSVSIVPDRTVYDAEGALDCNVFSSSLTAMQHTDIKLQEKVKFKWGSTEQINSESTSECKIKDLEERNIADVPIFQSNGKSMSDTPRQRKPVVMDFVETTYSGTEESQLMNQHNSGQSKEESNTNTICGRSNNMSEMLCPVEGPPSSASKAKHLQDMAKQPKHMHVKKATNELPRKYSQDCNQAVQKRNIHTGEKDNQTPDKGWCVTSEGDPCLHNPRVQVPTSRGLNIMPTGVSEAEKKHRSCEKLHRFSQEITEVSQQNLPPNTWPDHSEKVELSNRMTITEQLSTKGEFRKKP